MNYFIQPDQFINETQTKLLHFNKLESACRDYAVFLKEPHLFSAQEAAMIQHKYHHVLDTMTSVIHLNSVTPLDQEKIVLLKHARYLPENSHTHTFVELFYIFSGNCVHHCNGHLYSLEEGDFCFWEYNVPHYIQVTSDMDTFLGINIILSLETLTSLFQSAFYENHIISQYFSSILTGSSKHPMIIFHTGSDKQLQYLICLMYNEYQEKAYCYQSLIFSELCHLFVLLLRNHANHIFTDTSFAKPDSFLPVLQYLQKHYVSATLNEICEKYHYSSAHLCRLFKRHTGKTFSQVISQLKMEQAGRLLLGTSLSIADIAQELGYHDTSHFSTAFRRYYQCSPGSYRSQNSEVHP